MLFVLSIFFFFQARKKFKGEAKNSKGNYLLIGYIISQLGIELPDADFGYNPTTPRNINQEV